MHFCGYDRSCPGGNHTKKSLTTRCLQGSKVSRCLKSTKEHWPTWGAKATKSSGFLRPGLCTDFPVADLCTNVTNWRMKVILLVNLPSGAEQ